MTLAEIKAAAEAYPPSARQGFEQISEIRSHRAWLVERVEALEQALREARPYVYGRVQPVIGGEQSWREQTAQEILVRVDAALARLEGET